MEMVVPCGVVMRRAMVGAAPTGAGGVTVTPVPTLLPRVGGGFCVTCVPPRAGVPRVVPPRVVPEPRPGPSRREDVGEEGLEPPTFRV